MQLMCGEECRKCKERSSLSWSALCHRRAVGAVAMGVGRGHSPRSGGQGAFRAQWSRGCLVGHSYSGVGERTSSFWSCSHTSWGRELTACDCASRALLTRSCWAALPK